MPSKSPSPHDASDDVSKHPIKPDTASSSKPRISSQSLFQGASVLEVEHNGQIYRLQKTALNKLILTK